MERLGFFLLLLTFFFSAILATVPDTKKENLNKCSKNIEGPCGKSLYEKIFGSNKTVISTSCCYKLLQAGYSCHTKRTLYVLGTNPDYKNTDWIPFVTKSDEVFQKCDLITQPKNPNFLLKCLEVMGYNCGEEVFNYLVHKKNFPNQCCEKIVKMGKTCNTNLAKAVLRTPELKNFDPFHFLEKNEKLFDLCTQAE